MTNEAVDGLTVRVLFVVTALLWLLIGITSTRVPTLPAHVWVVLTSIPAGSALAVAHHVTRTAMRWYLVTAAAVAALRSAVWVANGVVGSIPVIWALIVAQVATLHYLMVRESRA